MRGSCATSARATSSRCTSRCTASTRPTAARLDRRFARGSSRNLGPAAKAFRCWSVCHGSMTGWYTTHRVRRRRDGRVRLASRRQATSSGTARRGIVAALGGHFGRSPGTTRASVWRIDHARRGARHGSPAGPTTSTPAVHASLLRDGSRRARHDRAAAPADPSPATLNERHGLTGGTRSRFTIAVVARTAHGLRASHATVGARDGSNTARTCVTPEVSWDRAAQRRSAAGP